MLTAGQILKTKPHQGVHTVSAEASVLEAAKQMAEKHIGALIVMQNDQPVGIITERDCSRKFVLMNRLPSETRVGDVMSAPLVYVSHAESAKICLELMADRQFRHLPVMTDGQVVGLISITDLTREIPAQQQFIITQLERYIRGDLR
jgi:IMP dehydrogenase